MYLTAPFRNLLRTTTKSCWLVAILINFVFSVLAQTPVTSYTVTAVPASPVTSTEGVLGYQGGGQIYYASDRLYDVYYATKRDGSNGVNRIISSFTTNSGTFTYEKYNASGGTIPFNKVVFNRREPATPLGNKFTALYEFSNAYTSNGDLIDPVNSTPIVAGAKTYLEPSLETTMEAFMNSYALNKGTDNVFNNTSEGNNTYNNIERIDLIYTGGIKTSIAGNLTKIGFLLNDRGGNDPVKVAAITGIDAQGNVTSVGALISVCNSCWGSVGPAIKTVVIQKNASNNDFRPSQAIAAQTVSGVYLSLANLGIGINTTIYGLAIYSGDQPDNSTQSQLVSLSNSPSNSNGTNGGLDLLSGNFVARDITVASPSLSGNVYHDADGLNGLPSNTISGPGIGSPLSPTPVPQLYANLIDAFGNVVLSTTVNGNGSFNFPAVNPGNYSIQLTSIQGDIFKPAPSTQLPANWGYIGEFNGTGTGSDGNLNGFITGIEINIDNITTPKFGIERRPESNNQHLNITKSLFTNIVYNFPSLSDQITVPTLSGSDPEDKPASSNDSISTGAIFTITTLPPANEAVLYYNNVPIVAGTPIPNYDPSNLQIKFITTSLLTTSFQYALTDAAGLIDLTPATYTINFLTILPLANLQLYASVSDGKLALRWTTGATTDADFFYVQQSINGSSFSNVEKTIASHQQNYTFNQALSHNHDLFYRVVMHYKNGNILYSNIVKAGLNSELKIAPNPAKNFTFVSGLTGKNTIEILNNDGKRIQSFHVINNTSLSLPTANLATGVYWIKIIKDKKIIKTFRLLKD
jgi:hypothetical protein